MIQGIDIKIVIKTQTGTDDFNRPIYETSEEIVHDVLVGEPSTDDITSSMSLYGKKAKYTLAIPKGDTHTWEDTQVILPPPFTGTYVTIGYPTAGIETNIPLRWNKKVLVEQYG